MEALRALDEGGELARRRVWVRVQHGIKLDRQRRRRQVWAGGLGAGMVAALVLGAFVALDGSGGSADVSREKQISIAASSAFSEIAADSPTDDAALKEFVWYLLTGARPGAR